MSDQGLQTLQPNKPQEDIIDFKVQISDVLQDLLERVAQLEALPDGSIEVKSDTGDFADADSWDGRMVLNTVDNILKVFEGGSWRPITSW